MIKFYNDQKIDLAGCDLLIAFASAGMSGNFAASLLIHNHPFENVGFFFSENVHPFALNDESGDSKYNGEAYFNKGDKILLLNFLAGCSKESKKEFHEELRSFYKANNLNRIIVFGGVGKDFLNDQEIRSTNVEVYFLTNSNKSFDAQFHSLKSFENLVKLEDKKNHLQEMKFMEKCGTAKALVKDLHKNDVPFHYLFAYSADLFDPQAGLALYFKIANMLKLKEDLVVLEKHRDNFVGYLEKLEKDYNLKFESHWKLFLKE